MEFDIIASSWNWFYHLKLIVKFYLLHSLWPLCKLQAPVLTVTKLGELLYLQNILLQMA